MTFTLHTSKEFLPEELRTEFARMLKDEIDARAPDSGARLLYRDEPEQLSFNFTRSPKTGS